jgi:hypothetical protein
MNERDFRLVRGIRDSLSSIQDEIRSIRNKQERDDEHCEPPAPSPVISAELQIPERIEGAKQPKSNRDYQLQVWLTVGTWLAFIAAAIYACIAYRQKQTMDATYISISDQTKMIRQQLAGSMAATLTINVAPSAFGDLTIFIENTGKVAAKKVHADIRVIRIKMFSTTEAGKPVSFVIDRDVMPPVDQLNRAPAHTFTLDPAWLEQDWNKFINSNSATSVIINATYIDGFDNSRREHVCRNWMGTFATKTMSGGGFFSCDEFDGTLRHVIQRLKTEGPR